MVGSNGGTPETRALVDQADLVVFVGCRAGSVTTERWRHPAPGQVRVVHIDVDPAVIGANYPTEVAARRRRQARARGAPGRGRAPSGRAARAARSGASGLRAPKPRSSRPSEELARSDAAPIRPERIVATLQELLPRDAVIVADAGTPCPYFSAYYELREAGRHFITNRAHGALGYALPAAVGAQIGRPGANCVAVMGDGSFGFAAGELETIVPPAPADHHGGDRQRHLRLDQGRAEERLRRALLLGRFHARPARPDRRGLRRPGLAGGGSGGSAGRRSPQALEAGGPTLVDVVTQPLHEARAPVSEWVA